MIYSYHKLVRDNIPQEIEKAGKKCQYHTLEETAYQKELDKKLLEEANEWLVDHRVEEMADLIEVIEAIQKSHELEKEKIEAIRLEKKEKKGGFDQKLYLVEVEEQENEKEEENRVNKQQALWDNLRETDSVRTVQQYIKAINTIRGFEGQAVQDTMLLLTEEIGELAKSIRKNATNMCTDVNKQYNYDSIESEVADCFYVLTAICNKLEIDLFSCLKEKEKENIHRVWKK